MIILLDYKGETFKWNFKLDNIPSINMLYFKNQLEKMVLYKTFEIQVLNFIDGCIHGVLFDKYKNRIGYGRGYYDKFLNKCLKKRKKLLSVGIAFSFQKHHNLPVDKRDFKLNHILTEKGIIL